MAESLDTALQRETDSHLAALCQRLSSDLLGGAGLHEAFALLPNRAHQRLRRRATLVAGSDLPVLLRGERGSGASLLAQMLHRESPRAAMPLVPFRVRDWHGAELTPELFGEPAGRVALARGGTLFLQDVEHLSPDAQAALIELLEAAEATSEKTAREHIRLLASTTAPLAALVEQGRFARGLFEHLAIVQLELPSLRDHRDELPALVQAYLDHLANRRRDGPWCPSRSTLQRLTDYSWPGNLLELFGLLDRAVGRATDGVVEIEARALRAPELADAPRAFEIDGLPTLAELERAYIEAVLARTGSKVYGAGGAAELLGLKPSTLQSRMLRLGVERPPRVRRRKTR